MNLVPNWKAVLFKSAANRIAVAGLALPELLQLVADHSDYIPGISDGTKRLIQAVCLAAVPLARIIRQPALAQPAAQEAP